jgi:hypothetical protein
MLTSTKSYNNTTRFFSIRAGYGAAQFWVHQLERTTKKVCPLFSGERSHTFPNEPAAFRMGMSYSSTSTIC